MKTLFNNKKIATLAFTFVLFLSAVLVTDAFTGPTGAPGTIQPIDFIFNNTSGQFKKANTLTTDAIDLLNPSTYTLAIEKSNVANSIGVGTEGILSWTLDNAATDRDLNRAITTYGKFVVDLSPITGTNKYARNAVKLFTDPTENPMAVVVSNKPTLGFWLDKGPTFNNSGSEDGWATGFFDSSALSSLIVGADVYRTTSYSTGTLADLDVGGETNIGKGDICVMQASDTCPLGYYLSTYMPLDNGGVTSYAGTVGGSQTLGDQLEADPVYGSGGASFGLDASYNRACTSFDPSPSPVFTGICPGASTAVTLGSAKGMITPAGAITAGAKWKLDGIGTAYTSGTTISGVSTGSHTIVYTPVTGYTTPATSNINVPTNGTATGTGAYTITSGSITATITPASAVTAGAKWRIDGAGLYSSGQVVSGIAPGAHTISFTNINNHVTPANVGVIVTAGSTGSGTGAYVFAYDIIEQTAYVKGMYTIQHKLCLNPVLYPTGAANTVSRTIGMNSHWKNDPSNYNNPISGIYYQTVTIPAGQTCGTGWPPFYVNAYTNQNNPSFVGSTPSTFPSNYVKPESNVSWTLTLPSGMLASPSFTGHP